MVMPFSSYIAKLTARYLNVHIPEVALNDIALTIG